jgi:hypothetical protein
MIYIAAIVVSSAIVIAYGLGRSKGYLDGYNHAIDDAEKFLDLFQKEIKKKNEE